MVFQDISYMFYQALLASLSKWGEIAAGILLEFSSKKILLLKGVCHITNPGNINLPGSLWRNRKTWWAQDCGSHRREAHVQRSLSLTVSSLLERTWVSRQIEKPEQLSVLRVQEPLEFKDTTTEKVFSHYLPPPHPYRHSLPLLQDSFSAFA